MMFLFQALGQVKTGSADVKSTSWEVKTDVKVLEPLALAFNTALQTCKDEYSQAGKPQRKSYGELVLCGEQLRAGIDAERTKKPSPAVDLQLLNLSANSRISEYLVDLAGATTSPLAQSDDANRKRFMAIDAELVSLKSHYLLALENVRTLASSPDAAEKIENDAQLANFNDPFTKKVLAGCSAFIEANRDAFDKIKAVDADMSNLTEMNKKVLEKSLKSKKPAKGKKEPTLYSRSMDCLNSLPKLDADARKGFTIAATTADSLGTAPDSAFMSPTNGLAKAGELTTSQKAAEIINFLDAHKDETGVYLSGNKRIEFSHGQATVVGAETGDKETDKAISGVIFSKKSDGWNVDLHMAAGRVQVGVLGYGQQYRKEMPSIIDSVYGAISNKDLAMEKTGAPSDKKETPAAPAKQEAAAKTGTELLSQAKSTFDAILATGKKQFTETGSFDAELLLNTGLAFYRTCAIAEAEMQTKLIGKPTDAERKQLKAGLDAINGYRGALKGNGVCPPQLQSLFDFADKAFQTTPDFRRAGGYLTIYEGKSQIDGGFTGTFARGVFELYQKKLDADTAALDKDAHANQSDSLAKIFALLPKAQSPAIAEKKPEKAAAEAELTYEQKGDALKKYMQESKPGSYAYVKNDSRAEQQDKSVILFGADGKRQAAFHYDGKNIVLDGKSSLKPNELVPIAYDVIFNPEVRCWPLVDAKLKESKAQTFENGKYKVAITVDAQGGAKAELFESKNGKEKLLGHATLSEAGAEKGSGITDAHLAYLMGLTVSKAALEEKNAAAAPGFKEMEQLISTYKKQVELARDAIAAKQPVDFAKILESTNALYFAITKDYSKAPADEKKLRDSAREIMGSVFPQSEGNSFYQFALMVYGGATSAKASYDLLSKMEGSPLKYSSDSKAAAFQQALANDAFGKYRSDLDAKVKDSPLLAKLPEVAGCVRILDSLLESKAPVAQEGKKEITPPPMQAPLSKITSAPITEAAWKAARGIFDNYSKAIRPDASAQAALKKELNDDAKYANFMAVFKGGEVKVSDTNWQFFTSDWNAFKAICTMVNDAAQKSGLQSDGRVFQLANEKDAKVFRTAISQMGCISISQRDKKDISDKERELAPMYRDLVAVAFTYKAPAQEYTAQEGNLGKASGKQVFTGPSYQQATIETAVVSSERDMDASLKIGAMKLSNSSGEFTMNYNSPHALLYSRHFVPDSTSNEWANQTWVAQRTQFLKDEGVSYVSKGKLADSKGATLGVDGLKGLLKKLELSSGATLENTGQLKENKGLSTERLRLVGRAAIEDLFADYLPAVTGKNAKERKASLAAREEKITEFMKGFGKTDAKVYSIWSTPETLKSGITAQESAENLARFASSLDLNGDSRLMDGNLSNAAFTKALFTMKDKASFDAACGMVAKSDLSSRDKSELLAKAKGVYAEVRNAKGPAFSFDEKTGVFSVANLPLAQKLFSSQEYGGIGLRFEIYREEIKNGTRTMVAREPKTAMQQLGAHFVWALEQGFTRSVSLKRSSKGILDIRLENYSFANDPARTLAFSGNNSFMPGASYTATVSVGYKIGGESKDFTGGKFYFYAGTRPVEATNVVSIGQRESDKRYEYQVSFTAPGADQVKADKIDRLEISAVAKKEVSSGVWASSGYVWAPMKPMPEIRELPVEKRHVAAYKEPRPPVFNTPNVQISPSIKASTDMSVPKFAPSLVGSTILNSGIEAALINSLGRKVSISENGTYRTGSISFNQLLKLQTGLEQAVLGWATDSEVSPVLKTKLGGTAQYESFLAALRKGDYASAAGMFTDPAYKTSFNTFRNTLASIAQSQTLNAILASLESPAPLHTAEIDLRLANLGQDKALDLNLYYNLKTNKFLISDVAPTDYVVQNIGAQFVLALPNVRFRAGGGKSFASKGLTDRIGELDASQFYAQVGADASVRLSELFSAGLQLGYDKVFAKAGTVQSGAVSFSLVGADLGRAYVGTSMDLGAITKTLKGMTVNTGVLMRADLHNEGVGRQFLANTGYNVGAELDGSMAESVLGPGATANILKKASLNGNIVLTPKGAPSLQFGFKIKPW